MDDRAARLDAIVRAQAPIDGISIGSWDDKTTWKIAFQASATDQQKTAANSAMNAFDPNGTLVPELVTPWQARAALLDAGMLDQVNALVDQQTTAVKMKWEFASEVRRDDPLINTLAGALNLTSEQLDALFIAATSYT